MNKKLFRRLLASALALCLVFSLAACSRSSSDDDPGLPHAEAGGSDVPYADGFDTTAKFNTGMNGDTLCIAFNGIQKRDTGYFQPAGDTITLTAAATSATSSRANISVQSFITLRISSALDPR